MKRRKATVVHSKADKRRSLAPPQSPAVAAAVYALADVMATAAADRVGNRIMAEGAVVAELAGRGILALTIREALDWALQGGCLWKVSRRSKYPAILQDTITLREIGNGQYAELLGPRPAGPAVSSVRDGERLPVKVLAGWREILFALGMKSSREGRQEVTRLNETCSGPIVIGRQGRQAIVEKGALWGVVEASHGPIARPGKPGKGRDG